MSALVDSSVWIDYFRGAGDPASDEQPATAAPDASSNSGPPRSARVSWYGT